MRDIWFIGAQILQDLQACFESLKKLHDEGRERQYVFDYYDFYTFRDDGFNLLSQVTNSLITGLGQMRHLPSKIFIFIDDLIFTSAEIYLPSEIEAQLRWIFSTIDNTIKARKRQMPNRALRPQEPRIFVVKSLPRYDFGRMRLAYPEFVYRQERFNVMLDQIGRCFGIGTTDTVSINPKDVLCFDENGNGRKLSHRGMYRFWRELCQTIADMDRDKDRENRRRIVDKEFSTSRKKLNYNENNANHHSRPHNY